MFLFLRELCGLFRPLPRSEIFSQRKQDSKERTFPTPQSLSLPPLYFLSHLLSYLSLYYIPFFLSLDTNPLSLLPLYLSFVFISITVYPFSCFLSLSLCTRNSSHTRTFVLIVHLLRNRSFSPEALLSFGDLMSKKSKRAVLDSTTPYGIGVYEDAKARLKYQTLMQDYEELQKDADVMRNKLEASKERKLALAAEVWFLRRRFKYLMKTKNTNSPQEQNLAHAPNSLKRAKIIKEQPLIRKETSQHRFPLTPEIISKKKQVALLDSFQVSDQPCKKKSYTRKEAKGHGLPIISPTVSDLNHKGVMHIRKEAMVPILDRNPKEIMFGGNDATLRYSGPVFDLNLETSPSEKEATLPTRAPIFDLNEISTGDEDFQGSIEANKFDDSRKSLIRGINDEQQNDLKLSICRNSGESSSRAGKRKISWQDPVALRV